MGDAAIVEALIAAGADASYRAPDGTRLADVEARAARTQSSERGSPPSASSTASVGAADVVLGASIGQLADLAKTVEKAGAVAGLTLRLEPEPCIGYAAPGDVRRYCVRNGVASDARRWGADLELRRRVLADALASAF